jgi:surfactin family lipopeptide synthetase A
MGHSDTPLDKKLSESKRRLLEKLTRGSASRPIVLSPTIKRLPDDSAPLGLAQEQVWWRSLRAAGKPPLYNEIVTIYREGWLEVGLLEKCLTEIIRRHESWRCSFGTVDGRPVQLIHCAQAEMRIPSVDLQGWPESQRETEIMRLVSQLAQQPFDLERGPLLKPLLFRLGANTHRLTIIAHQTIIDGISAYQVFPTELAALYEAFSGGNSSPLPELKTQYGDFAYWQRQWLRGEIHKQQIAYWRKQLAGGFPIPLWQRASVYSNEESFRGVVRPFTVPVGLSRKIREFSQERRTTLFVVLLTALTALLHCYAHEDDILIGTLSPSGRKRSEVQGLLGYFLNPVALRYRLSAGITFAELLQESRRLLLEAISNDDVPLEVVAEELKLTWNRDPFVKVAISLQPQVPTLKRGWNVTSMDAQCGGTVWDLYLAFIDGAQGLTGRAQYNPDALEDTTISSLLDDSWRVLIAGISNPMSSVNHLLG